jgi:tyrosyl-tRNA synthetase
VLGTPEALLLNQLAGEGRPFKSKTEARGFVERGAVSINNVVCTDVKRVLGEEDLLGGAFAVIRKGKRQYHVVRVEG